MNNEHRTFALVSAFILLLALAFLTPNLSHAAGPGNEVIVIYNTKVPESKNVADYYASRRQVPTNQVFGFALSTGDEMSRAEFRDTLQKPLAKALDAAKLWHIRAVITSATNNQPGRVEWKVNESKIRYAVLCYGIPFRIQADPAIAEKAADALRPELRRNEAAVDSELALLPYIEEKLPLTGYVNNPLFGVTNEAAFHPTNGVLMVTRLDGPSAEIARGLVDKALAAEATGLWGRAYFDQRSISDPAYKLGDVWIRNAAEICRQLGVETEMDTNANTFPAEYPMSQIAFYAGWYDNDISGPLARPNVEFMPGAFAYHLHSFSAHSLRSATKTWVGPMLAKGATISMGCVTEPFLAWTPDIPVFIGRLIFQGFTFGEAAYASQATLSWQTTVVGDPLYRPFGKAAQLLHEELLERNNKLVEWSFLRLVNLNLARGLPPAAMSAYLESLDITKRSSILSEKLGSLYAAQGKPSSAADEFERALKLDTSPLQRVRLRLLLADGLVALNRDEPAMDHLDKLLQENPDYPDRLGIYRRLLALAQKLGKKEAATNYEGRVRELTPPPPPRQP